MKIKRSMVFTQKQCGEPYRLVQTKNTTEYAMNSCLRQKDLDAIIASGIEVVIKKK